MWLIDLGTWLKSSVIGIVLLSAFGSWLFVSVSKGRLKIAREINRRLIEPYYVHSFALREHHEADGMPLFIYIAYQLARLVAYSGTSILFYVIGVIAFTSQMAFPSAFKTTPLTSALISIVIIAAVVYNIQAVRALLAIKLLYIGKVDPMVKKLPQEQREAVRRAIALDLARKP